MLAITKPVEVALRKGCDAWHLRLDKLGFERGGGPEAKTDSLRAVRDYYTQRSKPHLISACSSRHRMLDALKRQHASRCAEVELILESRLLLHLGRANVLENVGICADRTTGLPLVPGTALKGVLSTWVCWEANHRADGSFNDEATFIQDRKALHGLARRIFGDDSKDGSDQAGEVIFVGGFPATPPDLGLDIVNPHYEPSGKDKESLTPNAFLCVEPGTRWRFLIYVRAGAPDSPSLIRQTTQWLTEALTQLGVGAKTAAGYGRFRTLTKDDLAAQARQAQQAKAAQEAAVEQARVAAEKAKQQATVQAALKSDYPNDATYRNTVLRLADNPGQWSALQQEIKKLQKPENAGWLARFKKDTSERAYRKLREQPWYPK